MTVYNDLVFGSECVAMKHVKTPQHDRKGTHMEITLEGE